MRGASVRDGGHTEASREKTGGALFALTRAILGSQHKVLRAVRTERVLRIYDPRGVCKAK
jgi:hypothetical protein